MENVLASSDSVKVIIRTAIADHLRYPFLVRQVGEHAIHFDYMTHLLLDVASDDYRAGLWQTYLLTNGGFYLAPENTGPLSIYNQGNCFRGQLSADGAGIFATAMTLNHLVRTKHNERLASKYHRLRAFALQHREAGLLFRAMD